MPDHQKFASLAQRIPGYKYDKRLKQFLVVPEEAATVRMIFDLYLQGVTIDNIVLNVNAAGCKIRERYGFWKGSVSKILKNPIYAGLPDPNGILPGTQEPIISREIWGKACLERKRRIGRMPPYYCFSGKLKCGICGSPYWHIGPKRAYSQRLFWECSTRRANKLSCPAETIPDVTLKTACC